MFRYDAAGNLYEDGEVDETREYGRGNRLLRKGDTEYRWDNDGRLVERRTRSRVSEKEGVWKYSWNAAGLMSVAESSDGRRVEFAYDPFARRVQKRVSKAGSTVFERVPVAVTRFVWDRDVLVHEIKVAACESGDPIIEERTYLFDDGGFEPLAHQERRHKDVGRRLGEWVHYVNDPIGTPERLIAANGEVACELRRSAWGEVEAEAGGKASTAIRFQGQYADMETGLSYNRFRHYDPEAGRFISADPIGLKGQVNPFAYPTNPILWIDPKGLMPKWSGDDEEDESGPVRGEKGKSFRGGGKKTRDNWYGFDKEKGFQQWWHREGKRDCGKDIDNAEEAQRQYDLWVSLGKPVPK